MNTNRAYDRGVGLGMFFFALRWAIVAICHGEPSTIDVPSGGRKAAAKIISRTRAAPSFAAAPGSGMPPIE